MTRHVTSLVISLLASQAVLAGICVLNAAAALAAGPGQPAAVAVAPRAASPAPDAVRGHFVRSVTAQVLGILHHPGHALSAKKAQLETLFLHVVDLDWIARFVIGAPWEQASPQQRSAYVALYGRYLSGSYLAGLDETSERNLRDIQLLSMEDAFEDAFLVHTQMVMAEGDPVRVDYLVREAGGQHKVIDIVLEGVSLLKTHRQELGTLARSGGMEGIIAALQGRLQGKAVHVAAMRP